MIVKAKGVAKVKVIVALKVKGNFSGRGHLKAKGHFKVTGKFQCWLSNGHIVNYRFVAIEMTHKSNVFPEITE